MTESESETAVLVSPSVRKGLNSHPRQAETMALVQALGLELIRSQKNTLSQVHSGNYLQSGVIERLALFAEEHKPDLIVVDCSLSPVQQRNLERALLVRVIDRQGLILEIFAKRARSHEGRLQVELANLKFQESRLVRSWTHLERQRGGLGNIGGPGESQLEIDRRLLRQQIQVRERKIAVLKDRRALQRRNRKRGEDRGVALVGYTNAGKTTLFNHLCGTEQQADSRVFETLDTTMRRWKLAPGSDVVLSDTVGFIDDLPSDLIHAFRATLEEVLYADVIIHLHDYHAPAQHLEIVQEIVEDILSELDEDERPPVLTVYNKCENLDPETLQQLTRTGSIAISGRGGHNLDLLAGQVQYCLEGAIRLHHWRLRGDAGQIIEWLYQNSSVTRCDSDGEAIVLEAHISSRKHQKFQEQVAQNNWHKFLL